MPAFLHMLPLKRSTIRFFSILIFFSARCLSVLFSIYPVFFSSFAIRFVFRRCSGFCFLCDFIYSTTDRVLVAEIIFRRIDLHSFYFVGSIQNQLLICHKCKWHIIQYLLLQFSLVRETTLSLSDVVPISAASVYFFVGISTIIVSWLRRQTNILIKYDGVPIGAMA